MSFFPSFFIAKAAFFQPLSVSQRREKGFFQKWMNQFIPRILHTSSTSKKTSIRADTNMDEGPFSVLSFVLYTLYNHNFWRETLYVKQTEIRFETLTCIMECKSCIVLYFWNVQNYVDYIQLVATAWTLLQHLCTSVILVSYLT